MSAVVHSFLACAVCFGDPSSDIAQGARAGVWVMVGIVGFMWLAFGAMFVFWWRRARALQRAEQVAREGGARALPSAR